MAMCDTITADSTIQLKDGRIVGIASTGDIDGPPIFHFHGHSSSRLEVRLIAESAARVGVRLIGLDRPGIGFSDAKLGSQILDWPDIVVDVANQLGYERFAVEGVSGGGVYAMACAYKIPNKLTACGIISTVPPGDLMSKAGPRYLRALWWLGVYAPWLFLTYVRLLSLATGHDEISIEKFVIRFRKHLGPADQRLIDVPELRRTFVRVLVESHRQGEYANLNETMTLAQPWGFEIEKITFKKIFLWHGEQDNVMPAAPAHLLAQVLPHCRATFYPEEGHYSTFSNHADEILKALMPEPG